MKTLLREYIRAVLLEDDGGGDFGGGDYGGVIGGGLAGYTGVGMDIVSGDIIDKTLFKGWRDLFKTATSATKSLTASGIAVIKTALSTAINTIIPWYREDYKKIFQQHRDAQEKIRREHAATYNSVKQALGDNDDFLVSAMFYAPDKFFNTTLSNPSTFVASVGAIKAPDAIASMWDTLSGGGMLGKAIESFYGGEKLPKVKKVLQKTLSKDVYSTLFGQSAVPNDFRENHQRNNNHLFEADESNTKELKIALNILTNPNIVKMILSSTATKEFVKKQRLLFKETFQKILKTIKTAMTANTLEDFSRITGEKFEVASSELPQDQQRKLLDDIKKAIKKTYTDALTVEAKHLAQVVGTENDLTKDYVRLIKEIESA